MKRIRLKSQERSWKGINYCNRLDTKNIIPYFFQIKNAPEFDVNILYFYNIAGLSIIYCEKKLLKRSRASHVSFL